MKHIIALSALFLTALVGTSAQAKDLTSRLGVGYRDSLVSMSLPSIGVAYYPSSQTGIIGALGVDTEENNSAFAAQVGVRRIIFMEENMNFFGGGTLAMVNKEVAAQKESGFELAAVVGGEFFLSGLDSLGFNFETGVGIASLDKVRFRTLGDSIIRAGVFFYF